MRFPSKNAPATAADVVLPNNEHRRKYNLAPRTLETINLRSLANAPFPFSAPTADEQSMDSSVPSNDGSEHLAGFDVVEHVLPRLHARHKPLCTTIRQCPVCDD